MLCRSPRRAAILSSILLLALGLAFAEAPGAEPVAEYDCVLEPITDEDRQAYRRALRSEREADIAIAHNVSAWSSICAARFGWDRERQSRARAFGLATLAREGWGRHLAANGIDVGVIDGWAELYSDRSAAMDGEDAALLYRRLQAVGTSSDKLDRFGEAIGRYLAARETIADIRAGRPLERDVHAAR